MRKTLYATVLFAAFSGGGLWVIDKMFFPHSEGNSATAQTNQSISGDNATGNVQVRDNSGSINNKTINSGDITIIFEREKDEIRTETGREVFDQYATVLERLLASGDLSVTEDGLIEIAQNTVHIINQTPLERDNITRRQFGLQPNRANFLFGGPNLIAFERTTSQSGSAYFRFNGTRRHIHPGDGFPFEHENVPCAIIYNGFSRTNGAEMTVICKK